MPFQGLVSAGFFFVALFSAVPALADGSPFDGHWVTSISCPNTSGALGFAYDVPTEVVGGVLHGERLQEGKPGHLVLDGAIQKDGHALLYAKGSVGAAQFAVGQRPKGTDYAYHVNAQFQDAKGSGSRVEGRSCDLSFVRR